MIRHRREVLEVERYRPGSSGRIRPPVALASNESPYELPSAVRTAVICAMGQGNRYPDFEKTHLTQALADHHGVTPEQVSIDNGSSSLLRHLISACAQQDHIVVYPWPSFPSYEHATLFAGATPVRVPLDEHWRPDLDAIAAQVDNRTRAVFLCLPNNPTGTTVSHEALITFLEQIPPEVLVVIDECYHDYVTDPSAAQGLALVPHFPNIVVLKSFSKSYGLAGLRVGYALSSVAIAELIRAMIVPFAVSTLAQAAAAACLEPQVQTVIGERIAATVAERERVRRRLITQEITVVPSHTNFLYLPAQSDAPTRVHAFEARGIAIRAIGSDALRVSIGTATENDLFLNEIGLLKHS
ncbi:histidinol-phosphate transaminase [Rhodococcus pyridinivorans]|nr:histidinol-phosphate transaminase [Rhodococcus pyridinivorans]